MQVSPGGLAFRCGPFVTAVVRWFMPQICPKPTAGARSRFMAGHRGCAHEERPDDRPPHGCCNLVVLEEALDPAQQVPDNHAVRAEPEHSRSVADVIWQVGEPGRVMEPTSRCLPVAIPA